MSGPRIGLRVSVHTTWTRCGFTGSTARSGSDWLFVVMSFTRRFAPNVRPPLTDFAKYTSLLRLRMSVQTLQMLLEGSNEREGSAFSAARAACLARMAAAQQRPP